jgi:uncharacterized protein (TIGR02271 family)
MNLQHALRPGMRIVGPDNFDHGAVERYDDEAIYVGGRRLLFGDIERIDGDRLYVTETAAQRFIDPGAAATGLGGELRVPIMEERLEVDIRQIDLGEIQVHKTVVETEEVRRGPLTHEDVQIVRVKVNRPVTAPEERHQEGDWLVIPIMEEIFVVQKQLVVTEEIRIRKQSVTEEREIRETVRRERATIEDTRVPMPPPQTTRRSTAATRDARGQVDDAAWEELHQEVQGDPPNHR